MPALPRGDTATGSCNPVPNCSIWRILRKLLVGSWKYGAEPKRQQQEQKPHGLCLVHPACSVMHGKPWLCCSLTRFLFIWVHSPERPDSEHSRRLGSRLTASDGKTQYSRGTVGSERASQLVHGSLQQRKGFPQPTIRLSSLPISYATTQPGRP